jgi:hypothetical protein
MKITILGSCRLFSVSDVYTCSTVHGNISYPHYSKDVLELIKFCKYGHLTKDQTLFTFMWPIINKKPVIFDEKLKTDFETSDIFLVEIASKIAYQYGDIYVHHTAVQSEYKIEIKDEIIQRKQDKDEIEKDLLDIKKELNGKLIVVCHVVTYEHGERYILSQWLEELCVKHNILFINPIRELKLIGCDIDKAFKKEPVISHYTEYGHEMIKTVYDKYIKSAG